jgi:hypothetical protein
MNKSLLVEVFVPTTDDKKTDKGGKFGAIGTGYPVGRDIILTARHVIEQPHRDDRYPIVVRWYDYPDAGPSNGWFELKPEDVIWPGKDNIDAVLLRCPCPPEAGPYYGILTAEPPPQDAGWSSAGFPAAAKRDGKREPASFRGHMHSMGSKWHRFEVDVDVSPSEEEDWRGASGMPIFSHGKIYGLAKEIPRKFKGQKLHAVPACKLLEDDDFKKLIGYADQRVRRTDFERWLTAILRESTAAIEFLRKPGNLLHDANLRPDDLAASAANALLDCDIQKVIAGLSRAHEKLLDELRFSASEDLMAAAGVLQKAILVIVPCLFDHGVASGVRNHILNPDVALLEIPCVLPTLAEIVMAAAEDRPSEFRTDNDQIPVGTRQLPHPPETGLGGSKGHSEEIRASLMGKFRPGSWTAIRGDIDDYMFKSFASSAGDPDWTREQRVRLASRELKNASLKKHYMIYRLPEDEAGRRELQDGLRQLKKDYPSLVFLGLTGDFDVRLAESDVYGPLRSMLRRKLPKD